LACICRWVRRKGGREGGKEVRGRGGVHVSLGKEGGREGGRKEGRGVASTKTQFSSYLLPYHTAYWRSLSPAVPLIGQGLAYRCAILPASLPPCPPSLYHSFLPTSLPQRFGCWPSVPFTVPEDRVRVTSSAACDSPPQASLPPLFPSSFLVLLPPFSGLPSLSPSPKIE